MAKPRIDDEKGVFYCATCGDLVSMITDNQMPSTQTARPLKDFQRPAHNQDREATRHG
jgi:chorismate synthase